jgi:hypothetical protein
MIQKNKGSFYLKSCQYFCETLIISDLEASQNHRFLLSNHFLFFYQEKYSKNQFHFDSRLQNLSYPFKYFWQFDSFVTIINSKNFFVIYVFFGL